MSMVGVPPARPSPQWGSKGVLKQEIKYRTHVRSWKSYLFWVVAIIAFVAFLYLFDLLT